MPGRDVSTIRDLIYHQNTTITAKGAFTPSDGGRTGSSTGATRSPSSISIGC